MSNPPVMSRKYALEILEVIERRQSATYYDIGVDLRLRARPGSLHPVLMSLRNDKSKPLSVEKDTSTGRTRYLYSLTDAGRKMLEEIRQARRREEWQLSSREHAFVERALGMLWFMAETPSTIAVLAERMAIEPLECEATIRQLRLAKFVIITPDGGDCHQLTDLGRDFLDLFKSVLEGSME